jgi:two-component system chemotaxis sensor kinase CheA
MESSHERFMRELLEEFATEAAEHLDVLVKGLLQLESGLPQEEAKKTIETIFREIHSAKGAARAVNCSDIEHLCQGLESVFGALKSGRIEITASLLDLLHKASDRLSLLVGDLSAKTRSVSAGELMAVITELAQAEKGGFTQPAPSAADNRPLPSGTPGTNADRLTENIIQPLKEDAVSPALNPAGIPAKSETLRISSEKLQSLLAQAEELIVSKSTDKLISEELLRMLSAFSSLKKSAENRFSSINSDGRLDMQEFDGLRSWLSEEISFLTDQLNRLTRLARQKWFNQSKITDDLLLELRKTLLIPSSALLDIIPKIVRDLSRQQMKEVQAEISGGHIEIDRRILEELKDPLIHIIRNCVDHGIEEPSQRKEHGKPAKAKIVVKVEKDNDKEAVISISDDGRGIDPEAVLAVALKEGLLTEEAAARMNPESMINLVFRSGLSTSGKVTEISGRGLGLAIVGEKVRKLGGKVHVESEKKKGTTFFIRFPLTVQTFKGLLIRTGEHLVLIPLNYLHSVLRYNASSCLHVDNRPALLHEGNVVFLRDLGEMLGYSVSFGQTFRKPEFILILEHGENHAAFLADNVLGDVEGIIKSLGSQLVHVRHVSGASLLGDGKLVPVINVPELLNSLLSDSLRKPAVTATVDDGIKPRGSLLIVEDSLTSRSLLRNILESAGFKVATAVDGLDAYGKIQQEKFDLVVSDIEMPRMNGFELVSRIRGEPALSSLPLILVSSLDSQDDRQKGLEAGANAYIVKNSFQDADLISTIERFI